MCKIMGLNLRQQTLSFQTIVYLTVAPRTVVKPIIFAVTGGLEEDALADANNSMMIIIKLWLKRWRIGSGGIC